MKIIKRILGTIFFLSVGLVLLGAIIGDGSQNTKSKPVAAMTEEEREAHEKERLAKIESLEQHVKTVPAADYAENIRIYDELHKLDPNNDHFTQKLAHYQEKKREADTMERYPERFVKVSKFSWATGGFGNIMEVDLTIKSELPFAVKDIKVKCVHYAPSGTEIDSNVRVIYEVIKPNSTRTFRKFNMGFIHAQAKSSACAVVDVIRMLS